MRKLGVIDLDMFFPPADRVKLAMQLNGLAASPSFASWTEGPDLDMQRMLYGNSDKPQAAVVSIAHLSEDERQFVVTLLLSKMVTWMRSQPGTSDLRALVYMDEVYGYVPPNGAPPSKKPILTILKQARAYGVGLVLSTQNPVDIDYKALSNAGTWMIGRLQTEQDKARLLDGMGASDGSVDINAIGDTISALDKRQFVLHSTKASAPQVFGTRWAMSYLPGPLTREQIGQLTPDKQRAAFAEMATDPANGSAATAPAALADNESAVAPRTADNIVVRYLDPAVPYAENIGASATGKRLQAGLAVRVELLFDDTKSKLRHEAEWEAIITPLDGPVDPDDAIIVDYDDRDLRSDAPENPIYVLPDAKIQNKTYFKSAQSEVSKAAFEERCREVADERVDLDADKLRKVLTAKIDRVNASIQKAEDKIREAEFDAKSRKRDQRTSQVLDIAGGVLGGLLGGRRSTRSITGSIRRSQSKGRMAAKAEERLETVVGLEKTDISIDDVALVWIPVE